MFGDCLKKILIVEDEPHWQLTLSGLLTEAGYETIAAFDERDLFVQLRDRNALPILALVDLQLLRSGLELDTQANENERFAGGRRVLDKLRSLGVYAIVLSSFAPSDEAFFRERPEILDVVDKLRFTEPDFEAFFLQKVETAVSHAVAARYAEGKIASQNNK